MNKKIFVIMMVVIFALINCLALAADYEEDDAIVFVGLNEAVSALEGGGFSSLDSTDKVDPNATIRVQLDGTYLNFVDSNGAVVNPQIINDRTMVPMRKIFETFNAEVEWEEATRTVTATTAEKVIKLTIDNNNASVRDVATGTEKAITLDSAPVIRDDRTLVPVRFIAESLNKEVGWDGNARTVIIMDLDELAKRLEKSAPALKKLFDMNLESVNSFKSSSVIDGTIAYKDDAGSQTIKIAGNANVASNKQEEMEGEISVAITGDGGELASAVSNSGYDDLNAKVVLKGDKLYVGIKENGQYVWTDASSSLSTINNVSIAYNVDKINSYRAVVDLIKTSIGELNGNSYETIRNVVDTFGLVLTDNNVTLVDNGPTKELTIKLDVGDLVDAFSSGSEDGVGLVFTVKLIAENGLIKAENMNLDGNFNIAGETLDIDLGINSVYDEVNTDFVIEAPVL